LCRLLGASSIERVWCSCSKGNSLGCLRLPRHTWESGSVVAPSKADVSLRRRLHFHGFGVARQGPWITWVNKARYYAFSAHTVRHLIVN
jgi:hypothetical protein